MFSVVLIDDEPIIRQGLRSMVKWEELDCEVCGEAEDGAEGVELIREWQPDIIITDIRMREMDGLSMIREIRELVPHAKIIILSGYRDFEYARDALQLGAFDFMLKPSNIHEIHETLGRAVEELRQEGNAVEELDRLRALYEENLPAIRTKLLYDVICGMQMEDLQREEQRCMLVLTQYVAVAVEVDGEPDDEHADSRLYQLGISELFSDAFSDCQVYDVPLTAERIAFVVCICQEEVDYEAVILSCARFQDRVEHCFGITVSLGISTVGSGLTSLHEKWQECQSALEHKLYVGARAMVCYKDLMPILPLEDFSVLETYRAAMLEGVRLGDVAHVRETLESVFAYLGQLDSDIGPHIRNFYWQTIHSVNAIRRSVIQTETGVPSGAEQLESLYDMIHACSSVADLNDVLMQVVLHEVDRIHQFNHKNISQKVQSILDYVDAHYQEVITLGDIGNCIYTSTYYASRIFKQEMGKTFTDYLNEYRIARAKEFLQDVRYKVYEVADLVGIPDPHYFSKLFRKYTGKTPMEFRSGGTT